MLTQVIERLDYYKDLAGEPNVSMTTRNALKHPNMPNTYFIHVEYSIGDGRIYKTTEILEYLDDDLQWRNANSQFKDSTELSEFVKDCEVCNF